MTLTVRTVGHSTRSLPEFLAVLAPYGIEAVADVRRFPSSRRQPQYNRPVLAAALHTAGMDYISLPALGGRRQPASQAPRSAWRHRAFQGYAELLWWRCHRRMIADVLVSLGARVVHIRAAKTARAHQLTRPARLVRGVLTYAPERRVD
jgi:uncharacterized protein (DUF488 family)